MHLPLSKRARPARPLRCLQQGPTELTRGKGPSPWEAWGGPGEGTNDRSGFFGQLSPSRCSSVLTHCSTLCTATLGNNLVGEAMATQGILGSCEKEQAASQALLWAAL